MLIQICVLLLRQLFIAMLQTQRTFTILSKDFLENGHYNVIEKNALINMSVSALFTDRFNSNNSQK